MANFVVKAACAVSTATGIVGYGTMEKSTDMELRSVTEKPTRCRHSWIGNACASNDLNTQSISASSWHVCD